MVVKKENGKHFTQKDGFFTVSYTEISKEEYDRIMAIENWRGELNAAYEETMSDAVRWGYGFYGCGLSEIDGRYYYTVKIGSSCE